MATDRALLLTGLSLALVACGGDPPLSREELGEALFHDVNLSQNRTQACATCHDPAAGFADPRLDESGEVRAVSLGDDGVSLGDRNAPTASYAAFTTPSVLTQGTRARFNRHSRNRTYEGALGGLFLDGRALGLAGQAAGPPLNPLEMGMPSVDAVADRLWENAVYVDALRAEFGRDAIDDPASAYDAMTDAIAAYERTDVFAPFDSRYDRALRGELTLTFLEQTGRALFFSEFTNCAICHLRHASGDPVNRFAETFSGYEFHNVGVPENETVRAANGVVGPDLGLASNPDFARDEERGKYKVPTLRNVAVTGPYMHNGVLRDLRTVVLFYLHFLEAGEPVDNPETGMPWREPELPETVARDLLRVGRPLSDLEVDGLVCFLRALTDRRYEDQLPDDGLVCDL